MASSALPIRPLRRWTRRDYDRVIETGVFARQRLELLFGEIVEMTPQNVPHASTIEKLTKKLILAEVKLSDFNVRVQLPLALADDSEPEPDFALVRDVPWGGEHPTSALLIIEVADSSLEYDRKVKSKLYAMAGVPEYWIIDVSSRTTEVRTAPVGELYTKSVLYREGDAVNAETIAGLVVSVF